MVYIFIIIGALSVGVILGYIFRVYLHRDKPYNGVVVVNKREDGSILYSIEINGDPADLEFEEEVLFKVQNSNESSNRE